MFITSKMQHFKYSLFQLILQASILRSNPHLPQLDLLHLLLLLELQPLVLPALVEIQCLHHMLYRQLVIYFGQTATYLLWALIADILLLFFILLLFLLLFIVFCTGRAEIEPIILIASLPEGNLQIIRHHNKPIKILNPIEGIIIASNNNIDLNFRKIP